MNTVARAAIGTQNSSKIVVDRKKYTLIKWRRIISSEIEQQTREWTKKTETEHDRGMMNDAARRRCWVSIPITSSIIYKNKKKNVGAYGIARVQFNKNTERRRSILFVFPTIRTDKLHEFSIRSNFLMVFPMNTNRLVMHKIIHVKYRTINRHKWDKMKNATQIVILRKISSWIKSYLQNEALFMRKLHWQSINSQTSIMNHK